MREAGHVGHVGRQAGDEGVPRYQGGKALTQSFFSLLYDKASIIIRADRKTVVATVIYFNISSAGLGGKATYDFSACLST